MGAKEKNRVPDERWDLILTRQADTQLEDLLDEEGDDAYDQALDDLLALEDDPIPADAQKMRGTNDYYRIYICRSRYRAIYRVLRTRRIVLIARIGPRGSVYRGFERW